MRPIHNFRKIRSSQSAYIKKRKPPNGFSFFFKMYKNMLKEAFPTLSPQDIMKKAGERWRASPPYLKNSFIMYANESRTMQNYDLAQPTVPCPSSTIMINSSIEEENESARLEKLFYDYVN